MVGLLNLLEIDNNTFATVLEYCDGMDLDSMLKEHVVGRQGGGVCKGALGVQGGGGRGSMGRVGWVGGGDWGREG